MYSIICFFASSQILPYIWKVCISQFLLICLWRIFRVVNVLYLLLYLSWNILLPSLQLGLINFPSNPILDILYTPGSKLTKSSSMEQYKFKKIVFLSKLSGPKYTTVFEQDRGDKSQKCLIH